MILFTFIVFEFIYLCSPKISNFVSQNKIKNSQFMRNTEDKAMNIYDL